MVSSRTKVIIGVVIAIIVSLIIASWLVIELRHRPGTIFVFTVTDFLAILAVAYFIFAGIGLTFFLLAMLIGRETVTVVERETVVM